MTWNDTPVDNLYISTVELRNESLNDYENVAARVFTSDTILLTERSEIVGTILHLNWTQRFSNLIRVEPGREPTQVQRDIFRSQREYLIPTINRGQTVRLTFLNAAKTENQPSLWLDIQHKGVRLEFRAVHNEFWGVPQPYAVLVGTALGLIFLGIVVRLVAAVWIAAVACFLYGVLVLVPGALTIRLWRWLRNKIAA